MTVPGGGSADIAELLRQHGREGVYRVVEQLGLKKAGDRIQCPFNCCKDKGPDRDLDVQVFAAERGTWKLKCWSGAFSGDLLDLLEAANRWSKAEAIAHLRGTPVPVRKLQLVVPPPADNPEKLKPADVRRVWDALAVDDERGRTYLEGRGLAASPLVRYATEASTDGRVKKSAERGRRVAMLLTDVVGNPRGVQFRLVGEPKAEEAKQLYLKGSDPGGGGGAFFGQPELIEASPLVLVAEGMADTMALQLWAGPAGAVVGGPGKDSLHRLAEALRLAGIAVTGKLFALFPQNDRPHNKSRNCFKRLAQQLGELGAHVVWCNTPDQHKDLAVWRLAAPELEWPPAELARVFSGAREPGEDREPTFIRPEGSSVPVATAIRTTRYAQDFTTLCALLDDPLHREPIMGRGDFSLSEMTGGGIFNGRELVDSDYSALRLAIEGQGVSLIGKSLKYSVHDIAEAVRLIASRQRVHPVRDWLLSLKWDGKDLLADGLPQALGQPIDGFEAHLLRRWFISLVARPIKPGCKVDTVLVLAGKEKTFKSTFFNVLAGDEWFTDSPVNVDDDNGKMLMRKKWIVEWAELDSMRKARDQESIKAFLSSKIDEFRPPYGRSYLTAPRGCVIVGTTNNDQFLVDANGNRRFWPLTVDRIDIEWVRRNREQLLAQAVHLYKSGEQWWLEDQYDSVLDERHRLYEMEEAWEGLVRDWVQRTIHAEITAASLLEDRDVINKPKGQWGQADVTKIGKILKKLGWVRGNSRSGGRNHTVYRRGTC